MREFGKCSEEVFALAWERWRLASVFWFKET